VEAAITPPAAEGGGGDDDDDEDPPMPLPEIIAEAINAIIPMIDYLCRHEN